MDWSEIIKIALSVVFGGGLWAVIKSIVDKKKTPYAMLMEMLEEQKKFYKEKNEELEREKLDSAEKSAVISQTHKCQHRFKDPEIHCPVESANEERLKNRCDRCQYNQDNDDGK